MKPAGCASCAGRNRGRRAALAKAWAGETGKMIWSAIAWPVFKGAPPRAPPHWLQLPTSSRVHSPVTTRTKFFFPPPLARTFPSRLPLCRSLIFHFRSDTRRKNVWIFEVPLWTVLLRPVERFSIDRDQRVLYDVSANGGGCSVAYQLFPPPAATVTVTYTPRGAKAQSTGRCSSAQNNGEPEPCSVEPCNSTYYLNKNQPYNRAIHLLLDQ